MNQTLIEIKSDIAHLNVFHDREQDEILRLKFQNAALRQRLSDEQALKAFASSLQEQVAHLSRELVSARSERDRFIAAVRNAAAFNRSSLDQIAIIDPDSLCNKGYSAA